MTPRRRRSTGASSVSGRTRGTSRNLGLHVYLGFAIAGNEVRPGFPGWIPECQRRAFEYADQIGAGL